MAIKEGNSHPHGRTMSPEIRQLGGIHHHFTTIPLPFHTSTLDHHHLRLRQVIPQPPFIEQFPSLHIPPWSSTSSAKGITILMFSFQHSTVITRSCPDSSHIPQRFHQAGVSPGFATKPHSFSIRWLHQHHARSRTSLCLHQVTSRTRSCHHHHRSHHQEATPTSHHSTSHAASPSDSFTNLSCSAPYSFHLFAGWHQVLPLITLGISSRWSHQHQQIHITQLPSGHNPASCHVVNCLLYHPQTAAHRTASIGLHSSTRT